MNDQMYCEPHARAAKAGQQIKGQLGQQGQQQAPPQAQHSQQDWAKTLEANTAGAATNAEDFTKQFMTQMFGGASGEECHSQSQISCHAPCLCVPGFKM